MTKFSENLKTLRLEKKITHEKLAHEIGYSRAIIGFWENDKKTPTMEALIALADFFDITIDFLVGRVDESERKIPETQSQKIAIKNDFRNNSGNITQNYNKL